MNMICIANAGVLIRICTCEYNPVLDDFTMRIGSSSNVLIATLRENSFILAGPLRQKWITSVYTIYN